MFEKVIGKKVFDLFELPIWEDWTPFRMIEPRQNRRRPYTIFDSTVSGDFAPDMGLYTIEAITLESNGVYTLTVKP